MRWCFVIVGFIRASVKRLTAKPLSVRTRPAHADHPVYTIDSMRRSGMNQSSAMATYRASEIHGRTNASGIASI